MNFEGKIWKSDKSKFWLAEIPLLDIMTQAETKEELPAMVKDAIESIVFEPTFIVTVDLLNSQLFVSSNEPKRLIALMLKRQRNKRGLTQAQVAKNLGSSSINDYAQYEQAKSMPTLERLEELIHAIDPGLKPYISIKENAEIDDELALDMI